MGGCAGDPPVMKSAIDLTRSALSLARGVLLFWQRAVRILELSGADLWDDHRSRCFLRLSSRESCVPEKHPKAAWFLDQALKCITFAQRAKDARIKRLHALEAERWLRLAELKWRPAESGGGPNAAE
jgi:hypothetical protein